MAHRAFVGASAAATRPCGAEPAGAVGGRRVSRMSSALTSVARMPADRRGPWTASAGSGHRRELMSWLGLARVGHGHRRINGMTDDEMDRPDRPSAKAITAL